MPPYPHLVDLLGAVAPMFTRCSLLMYPYIDGLNHGVATISRLLKIIGLLAKESCKREDILQKRPIILRSLLIVAHIHLLCALDAVVCVVTGWLWSVGSMKLYVSFAKEPYKRDNILQKRPVILSILLTVAAPYLLQLIDVEFVFSIHLLRCSRAGFCLVQRRARKLRAGGRPESVPRAVGDVVG